MSAQPAEREPGLKQNAIGFVDALVIGLASTAPAYSLAAVIGIVVVNSLSENFLFDTLSALSLMIAFYYALSGIACVVYYRHELTRSVRNFLFIGFAPLAGAVILGYLLVRSVMDLSDPDASYTGSSVLGVGVPLFIGAAFLLLGAVLMVIWRIAHPHGYFERRGFEALPRDFAPGEPAPELAETPAGNV